jgi:hypothetical protein
MQQLAALARCRLGMSEAEFGRCTPRYFEVLIDQLKAEDGRNDARAALICAQVANFSQCLDREKFPNGLNVSHFMPGQKQVVDDLTPEQVRDRFIKEWIEPQKTKRILKPK